MDAEDKRGHPPHGAKIETACLSMGCARRSMLWEKMNGRKLFPENSILHNEVDSDRKVNRKALCLPVCLTLLLGTLSSEAGGIAQFQQ